MSARIDIVPTTRQSVKGALLSSFAAVPLGTAANVAMDRIADSALLGFLACLVTVMIVQTLIRTPITQRVIRRDMRRRAVASERTRIEIRRIEEVEESQRMLDPWHAATIANETAHGHLGWISEMRTKARRLAEAGRLSSNQSVIEALVDIEKNVPALTAEYARARTSCGETARTILDQDFLDALELHEAVLDHALSIVETEAREGFDARVRHLRSRSGDRMLGALE